jgi:hypothetical protein
VLHHDAVFALAWLLGLSRHLDPDRAARGPADAADAALPDGETSPPWRSRTLGAAPTPFEARCLLDLYYCLTGRFRRPIGGLPLPGEWTQRDGQRRWALEWAVVFHGPYHDRARLGRGRSSSEARSMVDQR